MHLCFLQGHHRTPRTLLCGAGIHLSYSLLPPLPSPDQYSDPAGLHFPRHQPAILPPSSLTPLTAPLKCHLCLPTLLTWLTPVHPSKPILWDFNTFFLMVIIVYLSAPPWGLSLPGTQGITFMWGSIILDWTSEQVWRPRFTGWSRFWHPVSETSSPPIGWEKPFVQTPTVSIIPWQFLRKHDPH